MNHREGLRPGDRLAWLDFEAHNVEQRAVWEAFRAGAPTRTPIIVGAGPRYFLRVPAANPNALDFRAYTENPDTMFDAQLEFQRWMRFNILQDADLGLPETWTASVDFQNYYDAAWFGCPVEYIAGEVPDTRPYFADQPERVMEGGIPDPFGGIMARGAEYVERYTERAQSRTFCGRPIEAGRFHQGLGNDGPMTAACSLFGPTFVCTAMAAEPERLQVLLGFITDALIARNAAWRRHYAMPERQDDYGIADDSIALISTAMYREHVMPLHRRMCDALGTPGSPRWMHLCGDATRHFVTLRDELNVRTFDTGFPVDFGRVRRDLGPDVRIHGGPHVEFLRSAAPDQVRADVRRILGTGILEGGMFVLREGNNLAPGTPIENTEAMYLAGREFGLGGPGLPQRVQIT